MQGTAQLLKVMKSPYVMGAMAGVTGIGMMLAAYVASGGGEDDDGEKYWDKVPDYVKERNLVIMLPPGEPLMDGIKRVGKRGRYITIPVQYGFNIFPNLGYMMADTFRNAEDPRRGVTPTKAAIHMTSVVFGSVNPFGGSFDPSDGVQVLLAAMPTLVDLPAQIITERSTFGRPSAPQAFNRNLPDSERMFPSDQGTMSAKIAEALNELGGGNAGKPGSILGVETSVTPGTIKTLISGTTGGLGSFVEQVGSSVIAMTGAEKDLKASNVPFLNKFYGEVDEGANMRKAGERMREVSAAVGLKKQQEKEQGTNPDLVVVLSDYEKLLVSLEDVQKAYKEKQSEIRKKQIQVAKDEKLTEAERRVKLQALKIAGDKSATRANRAYTKKIGGVSEVDYYDTPETKEEDISEL